MTTTTMKTITIAALGAVLSFACGDDDAAPARSAPASEADERSFEGIAGGIRWEAEAPLIERRTTHEMRNAEYVVDGHPEAVLAVSHFGREQGGGGAVRPNVDRWLMQVRPDAEPRVERREVNGLFVTIVDARGAFVGMDGQTGGPAHAGWRLLGAIVEGPEGLVFFKLTGPAAAVDSADAAFEELVQSIHRL